MIMAGKTMLVKKIMLHYQQNNIIIFSLEKASFCHIEPDQQARSRKGEK